jgi:hypothetical protein
MAPFSNLVFDVDAALEPANHGCMTIDGEIDWPKFTRYVVRFSERLRAKAAKAAVSAKSKSAKSRRRAESRSHQFRRHASSSTSRPRS